MGLAAGCRSGNEAPALRGGGAPVEDVVVHAADDESDGPYLVRQRDGDGVAGGRADDLRGRQEAAERLAALGGSDPSAEASPRR